MQDLLSFSYAFIELLDKKIIKIQQTIILILINVKNIYHIRLLHNNKDKHNAPGIT